MFPASVAQHHGNVRRLRCVVSETPEITLHHAQGGSVVERLRGMGMEGYPSRSNREALVIPLAAKYHCIGEDAIDGGIGRRSWELKWGFQADYLDEVSDLLGYNVWDLHRAWNQPDGPEVRAARRGSAGRP